MALIDMNCDMGEGFGVYALGDDTEMLRIVTSANIAFSRHQACADGGGCRSVIWLAISE